MNMNYEDDELKPYVEPEIDLSDQRRIDILCQMGYSLDEIEESLRLRKYDEIMANYLLLGKRTTEVHLMFRIFSNCFLIFIFFQKLHRTNFAIHVRAQVFLYVVYIRKMNT